MTDSADGTNHGKDPELAHTALDHADYSAGEAAWYLTTWNDPGPNDPPGTETRYARSGPHTLETAATLLKTIQNHPEPGGPDAYDARDNLIDQAFLSWIMAAAGRIGEEVKRRESGERPNIAEAELVREIIDASTSYAEWCAR